MHIGESGGSCRSICIAGYLASIFGVVSIASAPRSILLGLDRQKATYIRLLMDQKALYSIDSGIPETYYCLNLASNCLCGASLLSTLGELGENGAVSLRHQKLRAKKP